MPALTPEDVKAILKALSSVREILEAADARESLEQRRDETSGYPTPRLTRRG